MKSHLRRSKSSGSERAKIERLVALGWKPGMPVSAVLRKRKFYLNFNGFHPPTTY